MIAGTGGVIERRLTKRGDQGKPVPMEFYRFDLSVQPYEASAVEVHFDLMHVPGFDGPRSVVRIEPDGVVLGLRTSDKGPFVPHGSPFPLPREYDFRHAIQVERQPSAWFVTIDGQQLPGLPNLTPATPGIDINENVKGSLPGALPEFRLKVEDGPAWFSDIFIEELQPPTE